MIRFGLTAALVLGLAGAAYAQSSTYGNENKSSTPSTSDQSASPQSAPSTPASSAESSQFGMAGNQLQGRVESVDRSNNILTLSSSDKAIHIDASTDIVKDGAKASLSDIKEGDQVRASFQPSATGEVLHAQRLEVMKADTSTVTPPADQSGTVKEKAVKEKTSTEKSTTEKKY